MNVHTLQLAVCLLAFREIIAQSVLVGLHRFHCHAFIPLLLTLTAQTLRTQQAEEEGTAVGDMSVLPILGALGSESRAPAQPSKLSMQLPAFSELHRVSPLRATLAAALAVLQRLNGLSGGSAPLLPGSFGEAAIGASAPASHGSHHGDSRGETPPRADSSRNSSPAESPGSSSSDAASQSSRATSHASSEFAAVNGNGADLQRRKSRVSIVACLGLYEIAAMNLQVLHVRINFVSILCALLLWEYVFKQ